MSQVDLLESIFRINPEPMTLSRLADGSYVDVNTAFLHTFGYDREEVIGRTADDLGIWQDAQCDRVHIVELIKQQGFVLDYEAAFKTKSREVLHFLLGVSKIDAEGGPYILIVGRNITEIRHSEAVLRESEARYRGFIENLPLGVMIAQDGFIRYVNPICQALIGYEAAELIGRSFLPLVDEADREMLAEFHRKRMQGDDAPSCYDLRMRRKGGMLTYWRVHASSILWQGRIAGLIAFSDITAQKMAHERMTDLALHDSVTGLPNRTLLADHAQRAMALKSKGFAIIYLDLDGFKAINDQFGHDAGDQVLKEVAKRLHRSIRETDTAARVGGDEFVLLVRDIGCYTTAAQVAENVRFAISSPILSNASEHRISASIGVSLYPVDGKGLELLISRADEAMYRAKRSGRNQVCCYGSGDARGD
jgi:diguanylate cyclase (GGDEF)-like protein/PAS domain S-box-containing protein